MEKIKLIACDLDGTLLLNGAQSLRHDTCGLISRLMEEKCIMFCAASGRQYANLCRLFAPIKDRISYLCENGSLCYIEGKVIHKDLMDADLAREIITGILNTDGAEALVSGEKMHYIQPKEPSFLYHMRDVVRNDVIPVPDLTNIPEPCIKVSVFERGGLKDPQVWKNRFGDRCTVVTGGGEWLDMMPEGVNKAAGLRTILDRLGVDPAECMAIGDNDNDLEMLGSVGLPAAVVTAKPAVLALAKIKTDTVENLFEKILHGDPLL